VFLRARVGPFRSPQASGDWLELTQSAEFYASTNSDSRCYFHRVSPPKESMKAFLRESPLVHEHTGSDGVGHTSCDTGALIVVVYRRTDCRPPPNLCGTGGTLHKVKRLQVCSRRNLRLAKTHLQTVPGLCVVVGHPDHSCAP
jgi:hypothetical protein